MDIWLIGSDISLNAFQTSQNNINYAKFDDMYYDHDAIRVTDRPIINDAMVLQNHWPNSRTNLKSAEKAEVL